MTIVHRTYPAGTVIPYFGPENKVREVAYWAAAAQLQMERWEPLLAAMIRLGWTSSRSDPSDIWQTSMERHFILISANQLLDAMKFASFPVHVDKGFAVEIRGGRDLLEHWQENMPVFNDGRKTQPKFSSGKSFAAANPRSGPYDLWAWSSEVGPKVLPNVPASMLQTLVEQVKKRVVKDNPNFARFFHQWAESPWQGGDSMHRWEPKP